MKKMLILSIISTVVMAFIFSSCSNKIGSNIIKDGESSITEGWESDDIFIMIGMGAPRKDETDAFVRKAQSKEAAMIDAQIKVIEKFVGVQVDGAAGVENFRLTGFAGAKEISGVLIGGSLAKVTWDKDTQDAIVYYKIEAKGLKKRLRALDIKESKDK